MEDIKSSCLPMEMWKKIFSYLQMCDQREIRLVSRDFRSIIDYNFMHERLLNITDNNVKAIKEVIENQHVAKLTLYFKNVKLNGPMINTQEVKFVLQAIGHKVEHLSIDNMPLLKIVMDHVQNIKSLELDLTVNSDATNLNLCDLLFLENLKFINNLPHTDVLTHQLLLQLTETPARLLPLKGLELTMWPKVGKEVITLLMVSASLEYLALHFPFNIQTFHKILWKSVFEHLVNLKNLRFSGGCSHNWLSIAFDSLPEETPLKNIEVIGIESKLNDEVVKYIAHKWKNSLRGINFAGCPDITDVGIMELRNVCKLRHVNLAGCSQISNFGILTGFALRKNFNLEVLNLSNLTKLDDLELSVMVSRLPNLRILNLENLSSAVTTTSLSHIFRYQTKLQTLILNSCFNITDDGLIGLDDNHYCINRLRGLEVLSLHKCHQLTDRTLIEALHFPILRELDIFNCNKITWKGIESLIKNCPSIENLALPGHIIFQENSLLKIGKGLKRLLKLSISYFDITHSMTMKYFNELKQDTVQPVFTNCMLEIKKET